MMRYFAVLLCSIFLQACGGGTDIDNIKDGLIDFDKSLTLGEALDNWKECSNDKEWTSFKSDNGKNIVQFKCSVLNAKEYAQNTKNILAQSHCSEGCPHLDLIKHEKVFQWVINKDDSFELINFENKFTWDNNVINSTFSLGNPLRSVYANDVTYPQTSPIDNPTAQELHYSLESSFKSATPAQGQNDNLTPASEVPSNESSATEKENTDISLTSISGTYIGNLDGTSLNLKIEPTNVDGTTKVNIVVYNEQCDGQVEGTGVLEGNQLTISEADDEGVCTIKVNFRENQAITSEEGCYQFHGASCTFNGSLSKEH